VVFGWATYALCRELKKQQEEPKPLWHALRRGAMGGYAEDERR
jgi:hypothetical protein